MQSNCLTISQSRGRGCLETLTDLADGGELLPTRDQAA